MQDILVPVSPGELLDKITILRIKAARISDATKLANVRLELGLSGGPLLRDIDLTTHDGASHSLGGFWYGLEIGAVLTPNSVTTARNSYSPAR